MWDVGCGKESAKLFIMGHYRNLDIYKISFDLSIIVHQLSMKLPKYELYELGSQVRRSTKSIVSNIVDGFGRRRYKAEYIRYLIFAHASCDESITHLEIISKIHGELISVEDLILNYEKLGARINRFIQYVEKNWNPPPHTRNP
jgi:four helix bundle protein